MVTFMNIIKVILLALTMVFLFIHPKESVASKHPQQIITHPNLDDITQNNLGNIVAHKGEKAHSHPHNVMMGKKIKKEIKKHKPVMNIDVEGVKSLRFEAKKKDQRSKSIRKHK